MATNIAHLSRFADKEFIRECILPKRIILITVKLNKIPLLNLITYELLIVRSLSMRLFRI